MKYRSFKDLRADKNITPEDVAQFALYEREMNDSDKFKAICDLIVCCEKVSVTQLESQNKELIDKYTVLVQDYSEKFYEQAKEIIELREALQSVVDYEDRGRKTGEPRISDHWYNICKQALKEDKQDG